MATATLKIDQLLLRATDDVAGVVALATTATETIYEGAFGHRGVTADAPDRPRPFPEIEDTLGWPRRRIASVLGGVSHLRQAEFGGRRPYRFQDDRRSPSGRWEMWMDSTQAGAVRATRRT